MAEKAWRKAALDMGLMEIDEHGKPQASIRLHDFRRTVASRVYEHAKDMKLVKAILNHFEGGTTDIYVRLNYNYIARELQANADRFWSLKQEVHDDTSSSQPEPRRVSTCDSATADAAKVLQ